MKRKIDVTFEVTTQIEVDVPNGLKLEDHIASHKNEIAKQAREQLFDSDIKSQFSWNNLVWSEGGTVDFSDLEFNF